MMITAGLLLCSAAHGEVIFSEDSAARGLAFDNNDAQSVAWVDFNGDGWQDLWLAGHQMDTRYFRSRLYINNAGKSFTNIWPSLVSTTFKTDAHGSYWADYDNDGDQDLLVVAGGGVGRDNTGSPNMLFENINGALVDRAGELGLSNLTSRGRIGYWLDEDKDGKLDIMLINSRRPDNKPSHNQLFHQGTDSFTVTELAQPRLQKLGGKQLLLTAGQAPRTVGTSLDTANGPTGLLLAPFPRRVVQADLDGDGMMDYLVYAPGKIRGGTCQARSAKGAMLAYLPKPPAGQTREFEFRATGPVKLYSRRLQDFDSWAGTQVAADEFTSMYLSTFDERYHAQATDQPTIGNGIQVSWLKDRQTWRIVVYEEQASKGTLQFLIAPAATSGINLETDVPACEVTTRFKPYVVGGSDGQRREFDYSGLPDELLARGIVPGDFDNDTDMDLYISRGTPVQDLPDVLMLNNGKGRFSAQLVAAANIYPENGVYVDEIVPGPHIGVADYNNDGFLDLFQSAAYYYAWLDGPRLKAGVPNRLLTNQGNDNNWLQLKLTGVRSNRDAIGAVVRLYSGSSVQLRHQAGGIDSFDQHARPLHFGLGEHASVDRIEIDWPSGETSSLTGVEANQVLEVRENTR